MSVIAQHQLDRSFLKMYGTGGRSHNTTFVLHFDAIFSPFPFPLPSPYPSLPSSPTLASHSTPPLPFSNDVNKKLNYRRQNALSIRRRKQYRQRTYSILCVDGLSILAGRRHYVLDLSVCPFVTKSWMQYLENELTEFNENWHKWSPACNV